MISTAAIGQPTLIVPLSGDTVLLGFMNGGLQVWDLDSGIKVRDFESCAAGCTSYAHLPGNMIAVGSKDISKSSISVYSVESGKAVHTFTSKDDTGLCYVDGHLLSVSDSGSRTGRLYVWGIGSFGKLTLKASHGTRVNPWGSPTPLLGSDVAIGGYEQSSDEGLVEIWDWKQGVRLRIISGLGLSIPITTLCHDGRLAIACGDGNIRIGQADAWGEASVVSNGRNQFRSIVAAEDGALITTDTASQIKVWRQGKCEAAFPGAVEFLFSCRQLAITGEYLVAVGSDAKTLIVIRT